MQVPYIKLIYKYIYDLSHACAWACIAALYAISKLKAEVILRRLTALHIYVRFYCSIIFEKMCVQHRKIFIMH